MEAHLLSMPLGQDLPEDWLERRVPSLRRLLVILRHLPDNSPIAVVERDGRPAWSTEAQVLDDFRRQYVARHQKPGTPYPRAHPLSPLAGPVGGAQRLRTDRDRRVAIEESRAREAARQQRLAARREEA